MENARKEEVINVDYVIEERKILNRREEPIEEITEKDIYKIIYEAVKSRSRNDGPNVIHVSEVSTCLRKSFYMRTRYLQMTPMNALLLLGDMVHKDLQEVLRKIGYSTEHKVSIEVNNIKIEGNIDAYHKDKSIVLEIKTVKRIPESPHQSHLTQTQIYKALVKASRAYIVYINRNDGNVKVFKVEHDREAVRKAIERARILSWALKNGTPPKREEGPYCMSCEFSLYCKGRADGYSD